MALDIASILHNIDEQAYRLENNIPIEREDTEEKVVLVFSKEKAIEFRKFIWTLMQEVNVWQK